MKQKTILAGALATVAAFSSPGYAATWSITQDTYVYEFFGNQGLPSGDSSNVLVWNHESAHGAQGLMQVDSAWTTDTALTGAYTATLHLYAVCEPSGFVGACSGDPGAESVTTDVIMQTAAWDETAVIDWADINQDNSYPSTSFTQTSSTNGWLAVDVTDIVAEWMNGADDFGFVLSQENYAVIRADNGSVAVAGFCDSESSTGVCATGDFTPYLEISAVPVPAAVWLFTSGLVGLAGVARRQKVSL